MTRPVSVGYLMAPPESISASEWLIGPVGHELMANPPNMPGWQYSTDLVVERTLTVDLEQLRQGTALAEADHIQCVITWMSSATGLQGCSKRYQIEGGENHLSVTVPGTETGGSLRLRTVVTAALAPHSDRHPLAAHRPGSILWSDEFTTDLEGDASRFPTEALSFSATGLGGPEVAWRLKVDTSDLDASALSCVRIILNTDNEVYGRLAADPDSPGSQLTQRFLAYDVARQLVVAALAQEELAMVDYERASLGNVLRARLRDYFGDEGDAIEPLRARWAMSPSDLDVELQRFFQL